MRVHARRQPILPVVSSEVRIIYHVSEETYYCGTAQRRNNYLVLLVSVVTELATSFGDARNGDGGHQDVDHVTVSSVSSWKILREDFHISSEAGTRSLVSD